MKRVLAIYILLIAFNFITPNPDLMTLRQRHLVEFAQGNHTKSLSGSDVVKNKAVVYLQLFMIMSQMERIEGKCRIGLDSS